MKAAFKAAGDDQVMITFTPETADDELALRQYGLVLSRAHMINCRGFSYMTPAVEFLIQPFPRND